MSKQIKKITFAANNYGLSWLEVDTRSWEIINACGAGRHLIGRACRLCDRGNKIEYRNGTSYVKINADIEMMG